MRPARTYPLAWIVLALLATLAGAKPACAADAALSPVWTFPADGTIAPVASSPTVYKNVVYIGSDDGSLYALHATGPAAGTLLPGFPIRLDGAVKGRPAVYGDRDLERVYVATTSGSLYAFRLDGTPAWSINPRVVNPVAPIVSTPAVRGPYVFVTTSDGRILRFMTSDGRPAGGLAYGRTVRTTLSDTQGVTAIRAHLEVEDASGFFPTGRIRIDSIGPLGEPVSTTYTYSSVNTATKPHRLLNLSPIGDGYPLAAHRKGAEVFGSGPGISCDVSPAVPGSDDATLVITALDGAAPDDRNLVALKSEPYGLLPQWEAAYGVHITTAPLVHEATGRFYIGSRDGEGASIGRLHAIQASNGQPDTRWPDAGSIEFFGAIVAGPWLDHASGRLYFGATNGFLYAVRSANGSFAFPPVRLPGADAFHATPVMAGGSLYLGSHNGRFYSVPVANPAAARFYVCPDGEPLDTSPSASGGVPGKDVVVVGSAAGKILAFPVE